MTAPGPYEHTGAYRPDAAATCQWYAECHQPATTAEDHPTLGAVPICAECKSGYPMLQSAAPVIAAKLRNEVRS